MALVKVGKEFKNIDQFQSDVDSNLFGS